jgi:osmotically-inducible protein OsmY
VEKYQVNVSVVNGKVQLSGWVDSFYEQIQAESVASRVKGVVEVDNNLQVTSRWRSKTVKSDWEIRQDIRDELWWSPYVDSDEITVTVKDGVAILTGTVDSWREWWTASENAYDGGAIRVRNYLKVRDNPGFLGKEIKEHSWQLAASSLQKVNWEIRELENWRVSAFEN